jgi:glycosyltransferase involved in cell wall biosynthesis
MNVSIIVCCYNSESRIVPTLEHLSNQNFGYLKCEIILIDNNCTDRTIDVAEKQWICLGSPFELKVIKELNSGLSYARKCGVLAAKGEIIIFCDDDNWLTPNYITLAYSFMKSNLDVGVLAGQAEAVSNVPIPNWFYSYYGAFACGTMSLFSGDMTERLWVWGAGMTIRKNELISMYEKFKHLSTDRRGTSLDSGGDLEICFWFVLSGYKLWYEESLILKHFMPIQRLNKEYAEKLFTGQKKSAILIQDLRQYTGESLFFSENNFWKKSYLNIKKISLITEFRLLKRYLKFYKLRKKLANSILNENINSL